MNLAIKFSNDYINITEQSVKSTGLKIHKCVRGKMPEGAFDNGIVVNTNLLADALKKLLKEQKIRSKRVVLCISGVDVIQREIKIPRSAARHVRKLLKNELVKMDAQRSNYLFDYIEGEENPGEELQSYIVYMLPTELIRNYEQTLRRAGLELERVEPVSRSMEKLSTLLGLDKKEKLTILVDADSSCLDIMMSGSSMKNVYKNIQIKEENIEENVFIVSAIQNISGNTDPSERVLSRLVDAVSRLMQFQSQNSRGGTVDQILVYGEMAEREDFVEKLSKRTGKTVNCCKIEGEKVRYNGVGTLPVGISYSMFGAVCGRMVGEKKQLSFIKLPDEADTMTLKDQIPLLVGMACLVGLALYYCFISFENSRLEIKNRSMETQIATIEESEEYKQKLELRERLLKLTAYNENCAVCIDTLENSPRFEAEIFAQVDALVPEGISITGYEFEGNTVRFLCEAADQDGPAEFARIVTDSDLFEGVSYTGFSAMTGVDYHTYYSFQIECSR